MWQSKKKHTSFVKSFLHLGPDAGPATSGKDIHKIEEGQDTVQSKDREGSAGKLVQSFFNTTSLEDDSVSLKVLGI